MKNQILRLISEGHELIVPASDGNRLICDAETTFWSGIDEDFVKWGVNKPGVPTFDSLAQVYEIIGNGTFMDIFQALPGCWNHKWISQNQLIDFCENFASWLRQDGYANFFLIKRDEKRSVNEDDPEENLAVVSVFVLLDGMSIGVYDLGLNCVCDAKHHRHVVRLKNF